MYTIQKSEAFSDKLELRDAAGESLVLDIRLNINPAIVKEYRVLQVRLMDLDKKTKADPGDPETIEQTDQAICDLITLLFGAENFERMDDFYSGDHIALLNDIAPYICDVIAPEFREMAKARKAQLKRRFK